MFTTGFKLYFGIAVGLFIAAIVHGYATGGGHVGPLTWGWKGGVGDHIGYVVLMGLSVVSGTLGLVLVVFRDADPAAQAHYAGVEQLPSTPVVTGSIWPVVGAFGASTMIVGLALHSAIFVVGLVVCAAVAIEWSMDAWADRATGDPVANRELRRQVMSPFEIPVAGAGTVGIIVLAASRILLNASPNGAVIWAGVIAIMIFGTGALYASKPKLNKNIIAGLALVGACAVLAGGIVAAVDGEREFHPHHADDPAEEHSE
ncbi:MAG: hypothetical protein P8L46_03030 [Acidimicrobiales bacterium]|nr:hypothetical protein [Acidimicrobiales bacterium]MDG2217002.1 hypothetical protein [Acidimicrobiales bacterium]